MARVVLEDSPPSAKPSVASFVGSAGRTRLSDITNVASHRQKGLLKPVSEEESLGLAPLSAAQDHVQILKENAALLKLIEERNGIIEYSNLEIQKLKLAIQKLQQQNWQLAQSNSLMIAELNLAKDRLKSLQHEHSCCTVILKMKTVELEELKEKMKIVGTHKVDDDEPPTKGNENIKDDSPPFAETKLPPSRKRASTSQALCSSTGNDQSADKDDDQRRSTRRRSSTCLNSSEPGISDLPEIEERVNEDQPMNQDLESRIIECNKGKDEQEITNPTYNKVEQKQAKKLKRGRPAVKSQANELAIANLTEVKELPKVGITLKLDSQPSSAKLGEGKLCQPEIKNLPAYKIGRKKEGSIMMRRSAKRICAKDKEHGIILTSSKQNYDQTGQSGSSCSISCPDAEVMAENVRSKDVAVLETNKPNKGRKKDNIMRTAQGFCANDKGHQTSIPIGSKQSPVKIEDSPGGQRESSCSTSYPSTELTAENIQIEDISVSVTDSDHQDRKSLPEPTTKQEVPPAGRPSRRATIGISYKERPINVKMRRPN